MSDWVAEIAGHIAALSTTDKLTFALVLLTALLMVFTALIALFTYSAARATRDATKAQLLLQLGNEYGTDEMHQAAVALAAWVNDPRRSDGARIDPMRRRFSHFFQKVHQLRKSGLIDQSIARSAVSKEQVELYLAIEPLEALMNSVSGSTYDQSSFEFFSTLYGLRRNRASLRDEAP